MLFIPPEMFFGDDSFPDLKSFTNVPYFPYSKNKVEIEYDPSVRYTEYFGAQHLGKSMY
jgi:hypothetical protein